VFGSAGVHIQNWKAQDRKLGTVAEAVVGASL